MATAVAQVQRRQHVTDDGEDQELGPNAKPQEADHREQKSDTPLDEPELVGPKFDVRADEVALQPGGALIGGDPGWVAGRLEPAPQLLADIGKRPVGGADRLPRPVGLLGAHDPVDD